MSQQSPLPQPRQVSCLHAVIVHRCAAASKNECEIAKNRAFCAFRPYRCPVRLDKIRAAAASFVSRSDSLTLNKSFESNGTEEIWQGFPESVRRRDPETDQGTAVERRTR